jgi:sigma-B regulation protein RsbU (phosphoserine phosphatase)
MISPPFAGGVLKTLPGRLFILSTALWILCWVAQHLFTLPDIVPVFRKVVSLASIGAFGWLAALTLARNWRKLLWRVRRKLILSYLFFGLVPVVLVIVFVLVGGIVLYDNIAPYLFHQGLDDVIDEVHEVADTAAIEIGRTPSIAQTVIDNKFANLSGRFPELSLAVIPVGATKAEPAIAGPWRHVRTPSDLPDWVVSAKGFNGVIAFVDGAASDKVEDVRLVVRAAVFTKDGRRAVIVDLPCDATVAARIADRTGTRMGRVSISSGESDATALLSGQSPVSGVQAGVRTPSSLPFQKTVALLDFSDWDSGGPVHLAISLDAPLGRLYGRIAAVQSALLAQELNRGYVTVLVVLAVLFAIIEGSALVMGGALARSITSAVHELFAGTERVRQGDFTHRITVDSHDQLGELAHSFNRMSGSIEHLLEVQREKQRLDDELRIAREIQKSLLPVAPPRVPGLSIADLCEPAREVGGDYYDFFELGPGRLGVLIADVSGKGTSAALYMAELKGLMLGLSHTEQSPRKLLIAVNHLLAEHLDNRSFITATYAVIDRAAMTLTCVRAGHTPLIVVSGQTEIVTPDGMVLGLRLPGASERFDAVLEEDVRPIAPGDIVALYTDGVTEAMNAEGELFGETALASVICSARQADAPTIRERVVREVKAFVGDAEPHDDMTMVIVKVQ